MRLLSMFFSPSISDDVRLNIYYLCIYIHGRVVRCDWNLDVLS